MIATMDADGLARVRAHLAARGMLTLAAPTSTPTRSRPTTKPAKARKPRIDGQDTYGLASLLPPRAEPTPPPAPMTLADLDRALRGR